MAAAAMLELLCYKIITGLDENGRLAKQNMLIECKSHKSGSLRQKKQQKLNVKKQYRFKKATLYEREVIKKQKLPYSYNMW
jgi:hypothetical protein